MPVIREISTSLVIRILVVMICFMATAAQAAGDAENGAILANTCLGCHGITGYRNAYPSYRVPKLGGQHEEYIVIALQGYKNEMRAHLTMHAQAASLSEQDLRDLAAFFAAQGDLETGADGGSARGKEKVAVCTSCHGASGVSPTANWPTLAGQHKDYLVEAIGQYQGGERTDPVMSGLVANLSAEDIEAIATFYSAQPGLFTATYTD